MTTNPETETVGANTCQICGKQFGSQHGVRTHTGLAHKSGLSVLPHPAGYESGGGISVLPVNATDFIFSSVPPYIQQGEELSVIEAHIESNVPLLLKGPAGVGKTLSFATVAVDKKMPIIQFDCSEDVKRLDLLGRFVDVGVFNLGVIPTAIETANQVGRCMLIFEELNALPPQQQKILNRLLDWRGNAYIQEIGRTYSLRDGCSIFVGATSNPLGYGGTYDLNVDLKSRFSEYTFGYPTTEVEGKIIELYDGIDVDLMGKLITLAQETRTGKVSYAISPRDLSHFSKVYKALKSRYSQGDAVKMALKVCIYNRYDDEQDRKVVVDRIGSIFGLTSTDMDGKTGVNYR